MILQKLKESGKDTSMLTRTQWTILELKAIGLSSKEIADKTNNAVSTIESHIRNIKERLQLQKATELVAVYWCLLTEKDFNEFKKQILSVCLLLLFLPSLNDVSFDRYRFRMGRSRRANTELRIMPKCES